MTVKEIFELRRQGMIEEAYDAIRPIYAVHKGKFSTLCMFWTGRDILRKRIREKRLEEAEKIFRALLRVAENIPDDCGTAVGSLTFDAAALCKELPSFSVLPFLEMLDAKDMSESAWQASVTEQADSFPDSIVPSAASMLLRRAFDEIEQHPTADNALKAMPLLQESVRRRPRNEHNRRCMAVVYRILGNEAKAEEVLATGNY